ncbi:MAG: tRNA-dihydrouridine synthase, partial [Caulobacteraceae bacterium]
KAWLAGLSPKENREVPPLDHALVWRLKRERPGLTVVINGGIASLDEAAAHLAHVDGVMLGRAAYHDPGLLADVDSRLFGDPRPAIGPAHAVEAYLPYITARLARGARLSAMTRHMLGLFHGRSGARTWRRILTTESLAPGAGVEVVRRALAAVDPVSTRPEPAFPGRSGPDARAGHA